LGLGHGGELIKPPQYPYMGVPRVAKHFFYRSMKGLGRTLGLEISRLKSTIGVMESSLAQLHAVGFRPTCILDIGANKSDWSRLARQFFPDAKFILIEPQAEMSPALDEFCREAPGSTWKLAAAGPAAGEMELAVWPDHGQSSLVVQPERNGDFERRRVPIITIDSLFGEGHEIPQLAKLDIQGFELEALAGATTLFGQTECFIVETNFFKRVPQIPSFAEVVAYFSDRGYKLYDIAGHLRRPLDNALWQVDLAFVRQAGMFDLYQTWQK
jgi:FkbM family methyltransferase